jgi:trehalose-6-phosphate synthase
MPRQERRKRMKSLRRKVAENDVAHWSNTFLETLNGTRARIGWGGAEPLGDLEWTVERRPRP